MKVGAFKAPRNKNGKFSTSNIKESEQNLQNQNLQNQNFQNQNLQQNRRKKKKHATVGVAKQVAH